jgi:hypothetical protein
MIYATTGNTPILTPSATTFPTLDRDNPFPPASQPPVFPIPDQPSATTTKFQRISSLDPSDPDDTLTLNADVRINHHASIYGTLNAGTVKLNFPQNGVQINCKNLTSYNGLNVKNNTTNKVIGWVQVGSNVVLKNTTDDLTYLTINGTTGDLIINGTIKQSIVSASVDTPDKVLLSAFQNLVYSASIKSYTSGGIQLNKVVK